MSNAESYGTWSTVRPWFWDNDEPSWLDRGNFCGPGWTNGKFAPGDTPRIPPMGEEGDSIYAIDAPCRSHDDEFNKVQDLDPSNPYRLKKEYEANQALVEEWSQIDQSQLSVTEKMYVKAGIAYFEGEIEDYEEVYGDVADDTYEDFGKPDYDKLNDEEPTDNDAANAPYIPSAEEAQQADNPESVGYESETPWGGEENDAYDSDYGNPDDGRGIAWREVGGTYSENESMVNSIMGLTAAIDDGTDMEIVEAGLDLLATGEAYADNHGGGIMSAGTGAGVQAAASALGLFNAIEGGDDWQIAQSSVNLVQDINAMTDAFDGADANGFLNQSGVASVGAAASAVALAMNIDSLDDAIDSGDGIAIARASISTLGSAAMTYNAAVTVCNTMTTTTLSAIPMVGAAVAAAGAVVSLIEGDVQGAAIGAATTALMCMGALGYGGGGSASDCVGAGYFWQRPAAFSHGDALYR